jgi:hypothetical protein
MLPFAGEDCRQTCPFGYLLSIIHTANQTVSAGLPQPQLNYSGDLRHEFLDTLSTSQPQNQRLTFLQHLHIDSIAGWMNDEFNRVWLQPIMDFSIPPDRVYQRVSAWRLLDPAFNLPQISQQVVIIAPGGYTEAGGIVQEPDYRPLPSAIQYWQERLPANNNASAFLNSNSANDPDYLHVFTGGEVHAYVIHHLLNRHLVLPIPNLWLVFIAGLGGRGMRLLLDQQRRREDWSRKRHLYVLAGLAGASLFYGLAGLQLYISAAVSLPWVLPSVTFWSYILPTLKRRTHA